MAYGGLNNTWTPPRKSWGIPKGNIRFSLSWVWRMSRITRDGTAEPVLRDQLSGANGDREILIFPVRLATSRIGNLTWLNHARHMWLNLNTSKPSEHSSNQGGKTAKTCRWERGVQRLGRAGVRRFRPRGGHQNSPFRGWDYTIPYMVGKLAPNSSHLTRGFVKYVSGRGYFRAVPSQNGDKYVTSPPHPIVELVENGL